MSVKSDGYFAILPEWILKADVTAQAIRLYCVLNRHADKERIATPGRQSLANEMRCSRATVDRALKELVSIKALSVKNRRDERGDWTSNEYLLLTGEPGIRTGDDTGVRTDDETVSSRVLNKTEPFETEPFETEKGARLRPRKRQIPNGYTPPEPMIQWARKNFPMIDALAETAQFYDYHRARASTMVNWEAAWRTWIRKAEAYAKSGRKGHKPYSDSDEWGVG